MNAQSNRDKQAIILMFTKDHVTQSSHEDKKYNSAHNRCQEQASYRSTCATMHIIGYDSTKKVKAIVTSHMCIHSVPANCISTSLMWLTNSRPWSVIITLAHPNT